nr:urokinase plasminogen activator surface receptor-like [Misgurnus anguillicaudatus]
MELKIFILLFCALFTGGHSLKCYECSGEVGSCVSRETTCRGYPPATCASVISVQPTGGIEVKKLSKGCEVKEHCISGSVNYGLQRNITKCCNTDLCNRNEATDYNFNSPSGKQCYYCDGQSCFNRVNCLGDEDHCLKTTLTAGSVSVTLKGCASKSYCDATSEGTDYINFSCCKGNLCNSAKSVTQNLLFILWPLFFYILIH